MVYRELPPPPSGAYLSGFIKRCMELGLRDPQQKNFGEPWTPTTLAGALGKNEKTVSNYLKDKHPPRYPNALENVFFGPNQEHAPSWRAELRGAHQRTREKWATEMSKGFSSELKPEAASEGDAASLLHKILYSLRENGPTIIGGFGIAQGIAHLINSEPEELLLHTLWHNRWRYADLLFGIGGIVIGLACIREVRWARTAGICYCVAALVSAVFWFADEENWAADVERVVWITNILNPPVSLAVLLYFLFGWPERK
ncbi:hypothetical protein Bra1253DRAFT_00077 [Bradyrhizobium sp. WSM1253]|nr:hypothetical protein Bra1253DRAFT_00077 [Bradyrhizobium sp. WSM1253]